VPVVHALLFAASVAHPGIRYEHALEAGVVELAEACLRLEAYVREHATRQAWATPLVVAECPKCSRPAP